MTGLSLNLSDDPNVMVIHVSLTSCLFCLTHVSWTIAMTCHVQVIFFMAWIWTMSRWGFSYRPHSCLLLYDYTLSQELVHMWLHLRHWACLKMPLSSYVSLCNWRCQVRLRWHWKACSRLCNIGKKCVLVLFTIRGKRSLKSFHILDWYLVIHVEHYAHVPVVGAQYQLKHSLSKHMRRRVGIPEGQDIQLLEDLYSRYT